MYLVSVYLYFVCICTLCVFVFVIMKVSYSYQRVRSITCFFLAIRLSLSVSPSFSLCTHTRSISCLYMSIITHQVVWSCLFIILIIVFPVYTQELFVFQAINGLLCDSISSSWFTLFPIVLAEGGEGILMVFTTALQRIPTLVIVSTTLTIQTYQTKLKYLTMEC